MRSKPISDKHNRQDPLVEILADMLRFALAWEEVHGRPGETPQTEAEDELTDPATGYTLWPSGARLRVIRGGRQ